MLSGIGSYRTNCRVNVAARGVGIAQRALELGLRYSQERKTFGKPIAEHQAIQFKLADMATRIAAARLLTLKAARLKDAGQRSDLEAGMAKLFASETGKEVVEEAFRIHGGYGYSKEYEIERLYRYALEHGDELQYIPCFCGCGRFGHRNNQDCYIKSFNRDGTVTFTSHAAT